MGHFFVVVSINLCKKSDTLPLSKMLPRKQNPPKVGLVRGRLCSSDALLALGSRREKQKTLSIIA